MKELIGLSKQELEDEIKAIGEKPFRAKQLWHFIYNQGLTDFDLMTTISKPLRKFFKENYTLSRPKVIKNEISSDKSAKWVIELKDKKKVETVFIPEEDRGAVCISTQVGCACGCKFCLTGTMKLQRNLSAREIVEQVMVARDTYNEWQNAVEEDNRVLSNIVVMGMGEPLHNYDNTVKALKIIMDGDGMAISKRRITLSTSGVADKIPLVAKDLEVKLAVSLHASNDGIRNEIMPINRKYPINDLMEACKEYQDLRGKRSYITFEYVMLKGINDKLSHAKELIRMMEQYKIKAKFNLIPFNSWEGSEFTCSDDRDIIRFAEALMKAGYASPIRVSRGRDISAACGQLAGKNANYD
ncbi:MAG: Dual-specificity RNA methyltransferase RlmN [Alphaproteobacteria bacterium ADurb.Bin438]|nr:MAG: Dual-specificity RNA methyltransferase RlmN [Alphaproteobacteria bacterium ADurb.Bin438]